jgi:hypothetical protein
MKRLSTLLLFLVCMIPMCYAQDVVFFNDGSTLEGEILEVNPSSTLKIKTSDGGTFVVNMSEVDHLSKNGNVGKPSAINTNVRLIDRHGKDFYWVDNGKKLTDIDYQRELKGDLFKTFNSARKQFSNGGSLLFGGAILTVMSGLFYYSYLNSAANVGYASSGIQVYDQSKLVGFYAASLGADVCLCLGFVFRGIGKGRLEWVKDTYNGGSYHTSTKIGLSPSVMMTAQHDMGMGATLSFSF